MDPVRNPFAPGAGKPPPELAGRQQILSAAEILIARLAIGRTAKSFMLVGLRGVGKTVLLRRIAEMAEEKGLQAEMLEAPVSSYRRGRGVIPSSHRLAVDMPVGHRLWKDADAVPGDGSETKMLDVAV